MPARPGMDHEINSRDVDSIIGINKALVCISSAGQITKSNRESRGFWLESRFFSTTSA
jgi:hypothetical protein